MVICHTHQTLRWHLLCCQMEGGSDKMIRQVGIMSLNLKRDMRDTAMIFGYHGHRWKKNDVHVVTWGVCFESEIQKAEDLTFESPKQSIRKCSG